MSKKTKTAYVELRVAGSNKMRVRYQNDCNLPSLIQDIEKKFNRFLDEKQLSVEALLLYDEGRKEYFEIDEEDMQDIPDNADIKAQTCPKKCATVVSETPASSGSVDAEAVKQPAVDSAKPKDEDVRKPAESTESTDSSETEKYPICSSALDDPTESQEETPIDGAASAYVHQEKIWTGRDVLKVYFLNPKLLYGEDEDGKEDGPIWKCHGDEITTMMIMAWAKVWNSSFIKGTIPVLEKTGIMKDADIRVKFCNQGSNRSMVGTDAEKKVGQGEPTMWLNLVGHSADLQESLVVHEFGHALGLEHEHQRSDFLEVVEKHIDMDTMKNDTFVKGSRKTDDGGKAFGRDWGRDVTTPKDKATMTPYDPDSIMHYMFKISWIKNEVHRSEESIDRDSELSETEKQYLKGIVKRSKGPQLVKCPSTSDYTALAKAYAQAKGDKFISPENLDTSVKQKPTAVVGVRLNDGKHLKDIRNAIWGAADKWNHIGTELGMSPGDISAIDINYHGVGTKLYEMLKKWIQSFDNPQPSQLVAALESPIVARKDLAIKVAALNLK